MIHPSYTEMIRAINSDAGEEDEQINSRYSIVLAASKRARQLIEGAEPLAAGYRHNKPLSIAVEELYRGNVKILKDNPEEETQEDPAEEIPAEETPAKA